MPTDFSDQTSANFEQELNRARGYKPVTPREMRQAYKQYEDQGLKFGAVKKSDTDEELYARAQKTVLAWWKAEQKDKKERKQRDRRRRNDPMRGMESAWNGAGGGYSSGGTGGSAGGYGSEMLPDTAMRPGRETDRNNRDLPDIRENLTTSDIREELRAMGVPDEWQPPVYATRNRRTLSAWVERQATRRDLVLQANGARAYYNNSVVRQVSTNLGFPMDGRSIPIRYKHSLRAIRRYILDAKLAFQRRQATLNEQQRREARRRRLADEARQRQFLEF